jgi:transposase
VVNGSGVSRGDRRRNDRLALRRELVPAVNAVVGIDLGEDKQMLVVTGADCRVLFRRVVMVKASGLGPVLQVALARARAAGFASVTVACEPTGSRWMPVQELCAEQGLALVCVQPLATHLARQEEDYTRDKTDDKDAVLIARLASQLRCYAPEVCEGEWVTLRHLGRRRQEVITRVSRAVLQLRDLLALAWPGVLTAAAQPLESLNWQAAMAVVLERCDGDPVKLRRGGLEAFTRAVRRELPRWGGQKISNRIITAVFEALADTSGSVASQRRASLQVARWVLGDLRAGRAHLREVATAMIASTDALGLSEILATITGLSPEAGAQILAEAGDPHRFATARSLVKHAGLNPTQNTSATFRGATRTSKRGRPGLRLAAWRAAWAVIRHNEVLKARYTHLTTRQSNRLTPGQAHVACAGSLLRWIHAIITTGRAWDARIAAGELNHTTIAA